jgi:hypothetical protein
MDKVPLVIIELDPTQQNFFQLCNKNFQTISFMATSGVFSIIKGSATLNFDSEGRLATIKRELFTYAV